MRRVLIWTLLALVATMIFPPMADAQTPGITMQAEALYGGTSKYGEWLPVVVNLENQGEDMQGQVQVRITGAGRQSIFAQRVELARGARKQVTVYTQPNNFTRRLVVEFVTGMGEEPLATQQVSVRPVPNIRFITAAVSGNMEGLEALTGADFRGENRPEGETMLLPLSLATLPERPEALRTLDMLILTGSDTSGLTPQQRAALEQYVSLGGILVLSGGPEAGRVLSGIPASLQPVTLQGEQALDALPALQEMTGEAVQVNGPFPAAVAQPVAGASVRIVQEGLPLVIEREVGQGTVLWIALDPSLSPFNAWAGAERFWQGLVGERAIYPVELPPDVSPRQMVNQQLVYALQTLPSLDLPSLRLLVPLLGIYILVVGPLNYLILRRQRRMELAWATIPVITILFSIGAYGLGFGLRGSDVIVNQVSLVRAVPGGESGYVSSMIGVFSPARQSYDLAVHGQTLLAPSPVEGDPFAAQPSSGQAQAVLLQGEPAQVQNMTVSQWSMQSVMAESLVTEGYGFDANLVTAGEVVSGTLTNRTPYPWRDVVLVLGGSFERVGDIAPGETREVSLRMQSVANQPNPDVVWRIFEPEFGATGPSREVQAQQQILSSLYSVSGGTGSVAGSRVPVLLAWLNDAPLEVSIGEQAETNQVATTLLYSQIPIRFGTGPISLPRGMMNSQIVESDGGTCYSPGSISLAPDFEDAEILWELPGEVKGMDPSLLTLYVNSDGGMFAAPEMSLLNQQTGEWVALTEPSLGRNPIEEPDAFFNAEGQFQLRLHNPERNRGGCIFLDAGVEGVVNSATQAMR